MISGYQLAYNGRENIECYPTAVLLASATGLALTGIPCEKDGGKFLSLDWAIPCSENGVSVTGFSYERAINNTKPRADAVKTISVQIDKAGGTYGRWLVPDTYTQADFITNCCANCDPIAAVTIPAPIIFNGICVQAVPTPVPCVYQGEIYVAPLTGANTTFTATAYGYKPDGTAIVFSPTTSTGTTVALLAANMQTNWASETGSGTFTATGNGILFASTDGSTMGFTIAQS